MLEGLQDFTRYLADVRARYDRPSKDGGDRERGFSIAQEVVCEALRHMALTPETRAEVERLVQEFSTFSFASVPTCPTPRSSRTSSRP
jgi:hypothetical protein